MRSCLIAIFGLCSGGCGGAMAESGSCFNAEEIDSKFTRKMLVDLEASGYAFRISPHIWYAGIENLPDARICDLKRIDLSNRDLSLLKIPVNLLDEAILCNTVLPNGIASNRDC